MAVPVQKELHHPILEMVGEAEDLLSLQQVKVYLIERFSLTEEELQETVPSGRQTRFENRAYWAVSYLRRAGLLSSPSRALLQITPEGREFLQTHTDSIETKELNALIQAKKQDVGFEGVAAVSGSGAIRRVSVDSEEITPDEQMGAFYRELIEKLAEELLDGVKDISPDRFERLVVRLLERMGYGEGDVMGGSGDKGIDGIINQDPLGLEKVYIQAKRWQNQVGEPEIRNFSGSLEAKGANKGVFITTSTFSSSARQTAQFISAGSKFIRLIDGEELARLMINHGVGVIAETTYEVKQLDENYFVDL